ncbi:MAG: T9SS type A sorting domain-containing protein [Melioribacteraceae bacterium]|nr:T9SS type A sorting domain-containing protein [Melioribacteraceae bacterium]
MKDFIIYSGVCLFFVFAPDFLADNTAGSMLHVDPARFNHPGLTQLTWKAEIYEYDYNPISGYPFRIRIEFNSVGFMGRGANNPYCYIGVMVQNVGHSFENDMSGSAFSSPQTITTFPALGLYLSSLQFDWSDSMHGVQLLAEPSSYPGFGRVFENVDDLGYTGKNIYTQQNVGSPSISSPISVRWTVTKKGIVMDPPGNLSKNLAGSWVPLKGTFVIWNFKLEINGITYDVADYYLPIEKAEYIWAWDPLCFHQEYFGAKEGILNAQKGNVKYVDMRAFDGIRWYNLEDWQITWRIDDEGGNIENRFGWLSDGKSITSRVGHNEDISLCFRDAGHSFHLTLPITSVNDNALSKPVDNQLSQNYPNPFNPTTIIYYQISTRSKVQIIVYDILGKIIAILVDEEKHPGRYSVKFQRNNLSSGVYLYKLFVITDYLEKSFSLVRKMILMN